VERPEKWSSIGSTSALTDDSGQVVLSLLQNIEGGGGRTVQYGVAVVKPGRHDAARHCLGQVVKQQTAHITTVIAAPYQLI